MYRVDERSVHEADDGHGTQHWPLQLLLTFFTAGMTFKDQEHRKTLEHNSAERQ